MSSPQIKNISLVYFGKSELNDGILGPHEGRFAIVTERRVGVVMDALASGVREHAGRKRRSVRPSRMVLTPRKLAKVLKKLMLPGGDGDNKPAPPGRVRSTP